MAARIGGRPPGLLRFDIAQPLTAAQKAILWGSVGYPIASTFPAPTSIAANATMTAADIARDFRFPSSASATLVLSLPSSASVSPGFCTGFISNECIGFVQTIGLANSADKLEIDGTLTTNGTLTLLPKQKVSFYLDTDGWHTVWQDRFPLISSIDFLATPGTTFDITVPAGWRTFDISANGLYTGNGIFSWRSSYDGTTFTTAYGDRELCTTNNGGPVYGSLNSINYGYMAIGSGATIQPHMINGTLDIGEPNYAAPGTVMTCHSNNGTYVYSGVETAFELNTPTTRMKLFRLLTSQGTSITRGKFVMRGKA